MNEWIYSGGKACYNSTTEGYAINQQFVLTIRDIYSIQFTISGMTHGKLILQSLEEDLEFTANGSYSVVGIAKISDLVFVGGKNIVQVFDGCIDNVSARAIPFYHIKDINGNIVFTQTDETGVSAEGDNVQYQIDWSGFTDGYYFIEFIVGYTVYQSESFYVKENHDCTFKLTWTNNENAYGFDYSTLLFTPILRTTGKLGDPKYPKDKEVFKDSVGNRTILRSDTTKIDALVVSEMPKYLHDALAIGVEHDTFNIDDIQYVVEESEYTPKWRKSSQLAPVEVQVIKKDQNLTNENCA